MLTLLKPRSSIRQYQMPWEQTDADFTVVLGKGWRGGQVTKNRKLTMRYGSVYVDVLRAN